MPLYFRLLGFLKPHLKYFVPAVFSMSLLAFTSGISLTTIVPVTQIIFESHVSAPPFNAEHYTIKDLLRFDRHAVIQLIGGSSIEERLFRVCVFIFLIFLIKNIFWYIQNYFVIRVEQGVIRDLRNVIYEKYHSLPLTFFHEKRAGELISRVTNDVTLVRGAVCNGLSDLIRNIFLFIFYLTVALLASWRMALAALIVFPPAILIISLIGRKLRINSTITQEKMAAVTSIIQETVMGIRVVKAFSMEKFEIYRFARQVGDYFKTMVRLTRIASLGVPLTELLGAAAGALILWYGGRQIISGGDLTTSTFMLFMLAAFSMIDPIKKISQVNIDIQQGLAASKRIFEILDTPPAITDKKEAINLDGFRSEIRYEHVNFSYGENEFSLKDIDFKLKRGEILALVGPSGGGKSTIVDLLPRFYDPDSGRVTIDGIDIRDVSLGSLRSLLGIVTQDTILFNDTIAANIAYGSADISPDRLKSAATAAFADEFIERFPNGYDTMIGDRGVRLSGGQRQRLAIARALFKDPPILIFDEATSSLDSESELLIQKAIDNLLAGRTVIVVAHRLSTIRNADKILVVKDGRIAEQGSHEELIRKNGEYKKLYDIQFIET